MKASLTLATLTAFSLFSLGTCVDPLVELSYSKYLGQPLINGITQWLGIRYAAPPIGDLRFEPPQDPTHSDDLHIANKARQLPYLARMPC